MICLVVRGNNNLINIQVKDNNKSKINISNTYNNSKKLKKKPKTKRSEKLFKEVQKSILGTINEKNKNKNDIKHILNIHHGSISDLNTTNKSKSPSLGPKKKKSKKKKNIFHFFFSNINSNKILQNNSSDSNIKFSTPSTFGTNIVLPNLTSLDGLSSNDSNLTYVSVSNTDNIVNIINNLLLIIFRYHPNGIFQNELEKYYAKLFKKKNNYYKQYKIFIR